MKFILASASPRRQELLKQMGLTFTCNPADIEEELPDGVPPEIAVMELATLKAGHIAKETSEDAIVIGADTVVVQNGAVIGKPKSEGEAFQILTSLSGDKHQVYTGVCLIHARSGQAVANYEQSDVYFRELTEGEIRRYIASGEPMDKAGAYGIQGKGGLFVRRIEGDYYTIVGLPICRLYTMLRDEFHIEL